MENNVLSWAKALAQGYNPRLYPYEASAVSSGEYKAVLDFKIWAKKTIGISCYFTEVQTDRRFQLTVYIDKKYYHYFIRDVPVDFATCHTGEKYLIRIGNDAKGRTRFLYAERIV